MKVFDDHITLWNGGTLPLGYTVEMLMEPHESHPRNRLMANVFYLAGFIEAWGRGYEKIREAFEKDICYKVASGSPLSFNPDYAVTIADNRLTVSDEDDGFLPVTKDIVQQHPFGVGIQRAGGLV